MTTVANHSPVSPFNDLNSPFRQFSAPVTSPPLSPDGHPLREFGTFLTAPTTFKLDDELEATPSRPRAQTPQTSRHSLAAPPSPVVMQHSHALAEMVQGAFDDMECALGGVHDEQVVNSYEPPETPVEEEPTEEEQEWLDAQMDLVDGMARLDEAMEEAADEEHAAEEEFVLQMRLQHPHVEEDEARWLFHRQRSRGGLTGWGT